MQGLKNFNASKPHIAMQMKEKNKVSVLYEMDGT